MARLIAIGDIHGEINKLNSLIGKLEIKPECGIITESWKFYAVNKMKTNKKL